MHELALEEIRDRRKTDMRMRRDVEPSSGRELHGLQMIEKDERPDQPAPRRRPDAVDCQAFERSRPRADDELDRGVRFALFLDRADRHQLVAAFSGAMQNAQSLLPSRSRK
jgi:hypothetical protein